MATVEEKKTPTLLHICLMESHFFFVKSCFSQRKKNTLFLRSLHKNATFKALSNLLAASLRSFRRRLCSQGKLSEDL